MESIKTRWTIFQRVRFFSFLEQTIPLGNTVLTGSNDLTNCLRVAVHSCQNTSKLSSKDKVAFMGIHSLISSFSSIQDTPTWSRTWVKENLINHATDNYTKCSLWWTLLRVLAPFCQKWHRHEQEIKQYWWIQQSIRLILSLLCRLVGI